VAIFFISRDTHQNETKSNADQEDAVTDVRKEIVTDHGCKSKARL
jgi:hypothetical protein